MQFLAIVRYTHGGKIAHEFRCPLERAEFVKQLQAQDPGAKVKLRQKKDFDEAVPADQAEEWYGGAR